MRNWISAALLLISAAAANAQTPYAGMQTRSIKALSEQQVADLGAGRGMGLALAAELNGYPGPSHVLELADKLNLSTDQRAGVQRLFDSMKAEAVLLRETHLKYHLSTVALLSPGQMQRYAELRGYGGQAAPMQHHHH